MKNNIVALPIPDLLSLGDKAATGAAVVGKDIGLVINKPDIIDGDHRLADGAVRSYQTAVASRVAKALALEQALADARQWCFRAKDTLKPYLGDRHNSQWRPAGFVASLRVPTDYDGLLALVSALNKHLTTHPEQKNESLKVNVTAGRADELHKALKAAQGAVETQDELIAKAHTDQETALEGLRVRLRGLVGELKQLAGESDRRWRRFGLNIPAEPETPGQPEAVQVNNATPGQLLVSCAPVSFAERYRWFVQKAGMAGEPVAAGSSVEPLFVIENLEPGTRYNVFASAVNLAGNEGTRSSVAVAEVQAPAKAA